MSGVSTSNSTISTYSISTTTSSVSTSYDNGWGRRHETQNSIEATIFSDRPPPPTSSPPRSPNNVETTSPRGAVPRRSGSCSSTSSSGRSIDARVSPRALLSRSSPKSSLDSLTRNEARIEYSSNNRKVSSPTQTDNTGSWNRSNSPSRLSQTSDTESRIERLSASSKFRTGGRSSTSSMSSVSKASSSSSPRNSPVEEDKSSPRSSLCVSPQPGIEGLTLVQRTEIVLRVNAATSDAASQTDTLEDTEQNCKIQRPLPESRKKLPEEIECEELSKDLASQLSPNDKLVPILGEFFIIIFIVLSQLHE